LKPPWMSIRRRAVFGDCGRPMAVALS
jgi:hypothetical protein